MLFAALATGRLTAYDPDHSPRVPSGLTSAVYQPCTRVQRKRRFLLVVVLPWLSVLVPQSFPLTA